VNPFDYVNAILYTKKDVMEQNGNEKDYNPFLTNRALSYHRDSIFVAQQLNLLPGIDNKLQFRYLINTIRPMKRDKKQWAKKKENNDIDAVIEYFGYDYKQALIALSILSKDQLKQIKRKLEKGGL
jgi:hypothetical protein